MDNKTEYTHLGVRIEKSMYDQLVKMADKDHRTVSQVVRLALYQATEMHKTLEKFPSIAVYADEIIKKINEIKKNESN